MDLSVSPLLVQDSLWLMRDDDGFLWLLYPTGPLGPAQSGNTSWASAITCVAPRHALGPHVVFGWSMREKSKKDFVTSGRRRKTRSGGGWWRSEGRKRTKGGLSLAVAVAGSRPPNPAAPAHLSSASAFAFLYRFRSFAGGNYGMGGGSGSFLKVLVNNMDVLAGYAFLIWFPDFRFLALRAARLCVPRATRERCCYSTWDAEVVHTSSISKQFVYLGRVIVNLPKYLMRSWAWSMKWWNAM